MVAFEIRSRFGAFRDPFTISQHLTLPLPPKSAVAGMVAAVLGEAEYLGKREYREFLYSVVVPGPVRRKSFAQNFINDYTKKGATRLSALKKGDPKEIAKGFRDPKAPQKPANRELLIEPRYLIFVDRFDRERELLERLLQRRYGFTPYMGNSEFVAALRHLPIERVETVRGEVELDSFVRGDEKDKIILNPQVRYTPLMLSAAMGAERRVDEVVEVVWADGPVRLNESEAQRIVTKVGTFVCHMI